MVTPTFFIRTTDQSENFGIFVFFCENERIKREFFRMAGFKDEDRESSTDDDWDKSSDEEEEEKKPGTFYQKY